MVQAQTKTVEGKLAYAKQQNTPSDTKDKMNAVKTMTIKQLKQTQLLPFEVCVVIQFNEDSFLSLSNKILEIQTGCLGHCKNLDKPKETYYFAQ